MSVQGNMFDDDESENDLHWEAIERLLFIYAKLNPAISYVQGMNELIAPLYYVPPQPPIIPPFFTDLVACLSFGKCPWLIAGPGTR